MDDPVRVRIRNRIGELHREIERAPRIHRAARHLVAQAAPRRELVRQVVAAVLLADVEQRRDVGMRERRGKAGFVEDGSKPRGMIDDGRRKNLQRDGAANARVARPIHLTKTAVSDRLEQVIVRDRPVAHLNGSRGLIRTHDHDSAQKSSGRVIPCAADATV